MDLGTKIPSGKGDAPDAPMPVSPSKPKKKYSYPGFSLTGDKVKDFLSECEDATLGTTVHARVKMRVTSLSSDYENRISFDVESMDQISKQPNGPEGVEVFD